MLHRWEELLPDHVLQSSWIDEDSVSCFTLPCIFEEALHVIEVILVVIDALGVVVLLILLLQHVVTEFVDWKKTLEASVHVAVKAIIF